MAQTPLTKEYLDKNLESMEARITGSIRDLNTNFVKSQGLQNERMDKEFGEIHEEFAEVNVKLDAITKMLVMRQEMHNLIGQLRGQGIVLDESKIFVT